MLCNKGDHQEPYVRARLVACGLNHKGTREEAFYASAPPLEAKNILFHEYASNPTKAGVPQRLSFVDVRKAYFNGKPKRNLFMYFPRELGLPPRLVGRQVRCVYGTRGAGKIWEDCRKDCLEDMGLSSGVSPPCCFCHKERDLACVVHRDDFTCLGSDANLDWYGAQMALSFEL